jgi:IclR family acetate operon transcriptional repressor
MGNAFCGRRQKAGRRAVAGNSGESRRSVCSKLASILNTFTDSDDHSLTEVVRHTGLPTSTAHRLICQLVERRLLERDEQGSYRISLSLRMICPAGGVPGAVDDRAVTALSDLASATECPVRLGVLSGYQVIYIEKLSPADTAADFAQYALPACSSALGHVLLAYSYDLTELLIAEATAGLGPPLPTAPEKFRAMLAMTRITRVAIKPCGGSAEQYCMAMPVFGPGGEIVAALGLIVLRHQLRTFRAALSVAASSLSRDFAAIPPGHGTTPFTVQQINTLVAGL